MFVTLGNNLPCHCEPRLVGAWQSHCEPGACYSWTEESRLEIASSCHASLATLAIAPRMYENAAVCQGARVFVLFSTPLILIGHLSLEAVSLDACIRPSQGMSIFPEVSHSMSEFFLGFMRAPRLPLGVRNQLFSLWFTIRFIILQHPVGSLSQMTTYRRDGFGVTLMPVNSLI